MNLALSMATEAQLDEVGRAQPVVSLRLDRPQITTSAPLLALWARIAATLTVFELRAADHLELGDLDFLGAPKLRTLQLARVRVAPTLLAHPIVQLLSLRECVVGRVGEPIAELHTGPKLRSLTCEDSNFHVEHLIVDGPQFTALSLRQDEDADGPSFDRISLRSPTLTSVQHQAQWPTRVFFEGEFPGLMPARVAIRAGRHGEPTIDVSGTPEGHILRNLASTRP